MEIVLLVVLLALSAFFSGCETAFFSLRHSELAALANQGGAGRLVVALVQQPQRLLPALLIGNLLVNTAAGVVGTGMLVRRLGPAGVAVAVPVITLALLLLGEITPKVLALRYRRRLALLLRPALAGWLRLTQPLVGVVARGNARLLELLPGIGPGSRPLTAPELETACDLAVDEGALNETEGRFLSRLLVLQSLQAWQIMTPRPDVVGLRVDATLDEVLQIARASGFNRYPAMAPERNNPIGFFHLKDLLGREGGGQPLRAGLRPALFVPESKEVSALLAELRTGGAHMAMVVDEHGDFTGLVTLDDCLQALTGPFGSESDRQEPEIFPLGERVWIASGRVDLRALNETCGTTLEPARDYVTVAGLIMARLGRIPRRGDRIEEGGARLTVAAMQGAGVARVRVTVTRAGEGGRP